MNENLNLVEILKDCPKGTKLYSTVFGEVELSEVSDNNVCIERIGKIFRLTYDGRMYSCSEGECTLFPSREQRDWSKFKPKKPKFDPKTLQPFDKVLVRDSSNPERWRIQLFSNIIEGDGDYIYFCINNLYRYCIPYNDDTKHLVGTTEEAPEYYRYWED